MSAHFCAQTDWQSLVARVPATEYQFDTAGDIILHQQYSPSIIDISDVAYNTLLELGTVDEQFASPSNVT